MRARIPPPARSRCLCPGAALLGALALLLVLAACSRQAPRLEPVGPDGVIVAFGDSLTRGTGAGPGQSYPAVLEGLIGRTVVNAGVPGETTAGGLRRLPRVLAEHRPALVILCEGGNDFLRGVDRAEVARNLGAMLDAVRAAGAQAVLLAVPRPGLLVPVPDLFEDLAADRGVPCDTDTLREVLTSPGLKSDPIHPNAAGYRRIAEALARLLRTAGAVP